MSTSSTTASLFTPLQFTGISQYSSDFQSILSRATSIAELPVQTLTNEQSTIQGEQAALTTLGAGASAVLNSLQAIGTLGSGQALAASSSDTSVVTATNTGATSDTSYSITNVTSIASAAAETSTSSYTNSTSTAVSASGSMELIVGNETYPITLTSGTTGTNNLAGLESAINGLNAGVTASILTASSGNYLSVAADSAGATTLKLIENPQDTLSTTVSGSSAGAASATSLATYADATTATVSPSGSMSLVFGGSTYAINLTSGNNNLNGLASAINGLNAGVTASITGSAGSYGLTVTANQAGANTLQLLENPSNVLTTGNQGSNTDFDLNGIAISEPNTTVNDVIPGVTLNFVGTTAAATSSAAAEGVTINVATDPSQIESALQNLVTSYNTLQTAETGQFSASSGSSAGALSGNSLLYQIQDALNSVVQYQGGTSGGVSSLANLGIEIDDTGQMSLNTQTFEALSSTAIASSLQLLGSSTTGIGGLQQNFSALTDPVDGSITQQEASWTATSTNLTNEINTKNAQVLAMEQTLNRQLQAADALSAELTNQQSVLTASINSLDYTAYGYNSNSSGSTST